ncbi:DUF3644 domain-containing protein [Anaerocolumna aminovalerica]
MIKSMGEKSVYYGDNPNRTKTLENCIKLIFTNDKDPLRLNLEKIIELRNTSTHYFKTNTISINKSTATVKGQQITKSPKNKSSVREIAIPEFITA